MSELRYDAEALREFATRLMPGAGLATERAQVVAEVLLESDLLGHDTHGLDMLARYLDELADGRMARDGEPPSPRPWPATGAPMRRRSGAPRSSCSSSIPVPSTGRDAFVRETTRLAELCRTTPVAPRSSRLASRSDRESGSR